MANSICQFYIPIWWAFWKWKDVNWIQTICNILKLTPVYCLNQCFNLGRWITMKFDLWAKWKIWDKVNVFPVPFLPQRINFVKFCSGQLICFKYWIISTYCLRTMKVCSCRVSFLWKVFHVMNSQLFADSAFLAINSNSSWGICNQGWYNDFLGEKKVKVNLRCTIFQYVLHRDLLDCVRLFDNMLELLVDSRPEFHYINTCYSFPILRSLLTTSKFHD